MYKGMESKVRCGEKVIPLEHVKVTCGDSLRKKDEIIIKLLLAD